MRLYLAAPLLLALVFAAEAFVPAQRRRQIAARGPGASADAPRPAFCPSSSSAAAAAVDKRLRSSPPASTAADADAAFSAFADSLDEDSLFEDGDDDLTEEERATWQENLEHLLDPATPLAKRQILLSDLLNANDDIRESVLSALRERKIDPLLTPTGKKLQDGTRAVARQIASDILPSIASASSSRGGPTAAIAGELPTLVPKLGSRIFDAVSNQAKKQLEILQGDLADPARIPQRITKQAADAAAEVKNVFSETPEGLAGPEFRVTSRAEGYEIREYDGYAVASTSMAKVGEPYSVDDVASGGAAFNALAAYLFGANDEGRSMEMTTPVTTTSMGEMRFFLRRDDSAGGGGAAAADDPASFPRPVHEEDDRFNERGSVEIKRIPPARLAVARFTGFVTEGEVSRQKDALLSALAADGVEVDVPHGRAVPHVVFQYNPPYTIPIVRRNEIAVPVRDVRSDDATAVAAADLESEWEEAIGEIGSDGEVAARAAAGPERGGRDAGGADNEDVSPSDG